MNTTQTERIFKGWTKPGPKPPHVSDLSVEEGETLDAISGYFRLFQLEKGHRFSTDDVLTAWYATSWCPLAERVLDLGSGIGSVGMIAAWRLPGAKFVTLPGQSHDVAATAIGPVLVEFFGGIAARAAA